MQQIVVKKDWLVVVSVAYAAVAVIYAPFVVLLAAVAATGVLLLL